MPDSSLSLNLGCLTIEDQTVIPARTENTATASDLAHDSAQSTSCPLSPLSVVSPQKVETLPGISLMEVLPDMAEALHIVGNITSLLSLQLSCKAGYRAATPVLYRTVRFNSDTSYNFLFRLGNLIRWRRVDRRSHLKPQEVLELIVQHSNLRECYDRMIYAWRYVRHVEIVKMPLQRLNELLKIMTVLKVVLGHASIYPNATHLSIDFNAFNYGNKDNRDWYGGTFRQDSKHRPQMTFLKLFNPTHVCTHNRSNGPNCRFNNIVYNEDVGGYAGWYRIMDAIPHWPSLKGISQHVPEALELGSGALYGVVNNGYFPELCTEEEKQVTQRMEIDTFAGGIAGFSDYLKDISRIAGTVYRWHGTFELHVPPSYFFSTADCSIFDCDPQWVDKWLVPHFRTNMPDEVADFACKLPSGRTALEEFTDVEKYQMVERGAKRCVVCGSEFSVQSLHPKPDSK